MHGLCFKTYSRRCRGTQSIWFNQSGTLIWAAFSTFIRRVLSVINRFFEPTSQSTKAKQFDCFATLHSQSYQARRRLRNLATEYQFLY